MSFWQSLFSGDGFMPRIYCGVWSQGLIWLHVVSDAVIWLSYLWIPVTMFLAFRAQGRNLVLPPAAKLLLALYVTFIAACGFTHFFDALMFWHPVYRINGVVRGFTAVVSLMTAASLWRLIPIAVTTPMIMGAQERLLKQQHEWLRDILDSATGGILRLCGGEKPLPEPIASTGSSIEIANARSLFSVRRLVQVLATTASFSQQRSDDLITAAHEAAMNALRHAGGGTMRCYQNGEQIQIWIEDTGSGIALDKLPIATLKQGYSTAGTAGQGWHLILSLVDTAYLKTTEQGTQVVILMDRLKPEPFIPVNEQVGGTVTIVASLRTAPVAT